MKEIYIFLGCLFFLNPSFAQPFLSMLEEGNEWYIRETSCGGGTCDTYYRYYEVDHEEIINGTTYTNVLYQGGPSRITVREENGIVYVYSFSTNSEAVFYDFNLEIGDFFTYPTEEYYILGGSNIIPTVEVVNKSIQFIAGQNRLVIELEEVGTGIPVEEWIEGLGSTRGFESGGIYMEGYTDLECFRSDGVNYSFGGMCELGNTDSNLNLIQLAPNPVSDGSILNLPKEFNIDTVRIIDITGRIVHEIEVESESISIDASTYGSGLYFYQALSENTVIKTDRFIVK